MSQLNHLGSILPQNTGLGDAADQPGIAQPISQAEIEDLLYGEDRPAEERLQRLRDFREELAAREAGDFGDDDPRALMGEIDEAIARLEGVDGDETAEYAELEPAIDRDPRDHRETMAPDDDELDQIEEEDEDSVEDDIGPLDASEWDDEDEEEEAER